MWPSDDEIVIRPADKGSGIVVMDRDEYVRKLQSEMSDSATYEEVPGDRTRTVQNKVKKVVDTLYKKGSIDNELRRYMTGYDGTSGKLQGNPKLLNLVCHYAQSSTAGTTRQKIWRRSWKMSNENM